MCTIDTIRYDSCNHPKFQKFKSFELLPYLPQTQSPLPQPAPFCLQSRCQTSQSWSIALPSPGLKINRQAKLYRSEDNAAKGAVLLQVQKFIKLNSQSLGYSQESCCMQNCVYWVVTSFFMAFSAFLLIFLVESSSLLLLKST